MSVYDWLCGISDSLRSRAGSVRGKKNIECSELAKRDEIGAITIH